MEAVFGRYQAEIRLDRTRIIDRFEIPNLDCLELH
jgi:hypothetical protein